MLKRFTFASVIALSAVLALPGALAAEPGAETVVARVNGQDITLGHMIVAHATLPQQYRDLPANVLYDAILNQLIQQTALQQAHTGGEPHHVTLSLENERRSLIAAEEIENIMAGAASPEEIKAAYDAKFSDGFGGEEFNAAHILVDSQEEAAELKAALDRGADFAKMAQEKSTGPSGPSGGSLGWFGLGAMVPEFEAAVVAMEVGEVSAPVQTQFGWHVIKLNEKRKSSAPALEEVADEIAGELRKKAVEDRVEALTKAATIERPAIEGLDPEILRNLNLLRN